MRRALLVWVMFGLAACGSTDSQGGEVPTVVSHDDGMTDTPPDTTSPPGTTTPTETAPPTETASPPGKVPGKLGAACGGLAGFACEPQLECHLEEPIHPDQMGTCQPKTEKH